LHHHGYFETEEVFFRKTNMDAVEKGNQSENEEFRFARWKEREWVPLGTWLAVTVSLLRKQMDIELRVKDWRLLIGNVCSRGEDNHRIDWFVSLLTVTFSFLSSTEVSSIRC
jgi:hypothetical protein